jgi:1,4-dihydroxy-2-naphthoate octaprenyltransferase
MDVPHDIPRSSTGRAIRAGRLPFLTASLLPAAVGAAMGGESARPVLAGVGVLAVGAGHLSANLMNDVGDAATGVDAMDERYFGFFGGSKLIQLGVVPAGVYFAASMAAAVISLAAAGVLAAVWRDGWPLAIAGAAVLLAWTYSAGPIPLSYHYAGEAAVLLLFGPVATLAGYYAATGVLWSAEVLLASLPLGLMTASVLVANEVPDASEDAVAGKDNLIGLLGAGRGWLAYLGVVAVAIGLAAVTIVAAPLSSTAWLALGAAVPASLAGSVLRRNFRQKARLVRSAALAILAQAWLAVGLLLGALLA